MNTINVMILSGDVVAAPTVRKAANGKEFSQFALAVNSDWRDLETGEMKKQQVDFHFQRVIAWGKCGQAAKKLAKGARVTVEGQLIIRLEKGFDKVYHYITEIVAKNITVI